MNQTPHTQTVQRQKERQSKQWPFWVGGGLLLLAAVLIVWPRVRNNSLRRSWVPLELPISLEKGSIVTPQFHPVLDTDYYISIEVQRKIEFQRLQCMLGLGDFEQCKDIPEVMDISWVVTSGNKTIAEGQSQDHHGGSYSDTIARTIGQFRGGNSLVTIIRATVNKDASELNQANPRLSVSVHPSLWEGDIIGQQLAFFAACLVGLVGVIALSFGGVSRFLAWKQSRSQTL